MDISVILCTYNRCERLPRALESLAASELLDSMQWEVIIVDNNSKDRTREVAQEICSASAGRFRYIFEPRPGKSNALNRGIREAKGKVLAFIDDDVTAERSWLRNLTHELFDGDWVGAGGRILPEWGCQTPSWLPENFRELGPLAVFDLGDKVGPLQEAPFGTNMAFQRSMFEKYGTFRTDLGPNPFNQIRSEDSEFALRLIDAREKLRYEPTAVVYHYVPPDRLQKAYFLKWWRDKGRADMRQYGIPPSRWSIAGVPAIMLSRLVTWTVRWLLSIDPLRRFDAKLKVWGNAGMVQEAYRLGRCPDLGAQVLGKCREHEGEFTIHAQKK